MCRSLLPVALTLLLLLAGCAAPTTGDGHDGDGQGRTVAVSLSNQHEEAYAVRIAVASGDLDGVRVRYADGSTRTYDVANVSALPPGATANATDVEPLGDGVRAERFVLDPGAGLGTRFEDVPADARLLFVVSAGGGDGPLRGVGTSRCATSGTGLDVSLVVGVDGTIDVSTTCSTGSPSTIG